MLDHKTRLNNDIRAHIVKRALETSGVVEAEKQLIEDRAAFAEKVRLLIIEKEGLTDKEIRNFYNSVSGSHKGAKFNSFITTSISGSSQKFEVAINGQVRTLYLNGSNKRGCDTHIEIKSCYEGGPFCPRARYLLADNALLDEINNLDMRAEVLGHQRTTVIDSVAAAVKRAGTVKTLLEAWPEAIELLPNDFQKPTGTGLALNPETLNAICGIPTGE